MKKTKDYTEAREELIKWRDELKAKEDRLQQEEQETDKQYKEVLAEEAVLGDRQKAATEESDEERWLKELELQAKIAERKAKNIRFALYIPLGILALALVILFAVTANQNRKSLEDAVSKMDSLEADYRDGEDYLNREYQHTSLLEQLEKEYLQKKEQLEAEILNLKTLILTDAKGAESDTAQGVMVLTAKNEDEIREYIKNMPTVSDKSLETVYFRDDAYYVCREKYELPFYGNISSGTNTIYPGALIKGDTLFTGNYSIVPVKRGGMDLVCNIAGSSTETVDEVTYGNVLSKLSVYQELAEKDGRYKETKFEKQIVTSSAELSASLGLGADAGIALFDIGANVGGNVGKAYNEEKTNLLVNIRQIAYTVSAQPPQDCIDYFAKGADISQLGMYAPAYISSVDYGRSIILMITSDESEEELTNEIDAAISFSLKKLAGLTISADAEAEYKKIMKNSSATCNITVVGGNAEGAEFTSMTVANCMEKLSELLAEGEEGGIVSPVPISYTMNYVQNNNVVPCVQIAKEVMMPKSEAKVVKLQWNDDTLKGTFSYQIEGVGEDIIVLQPNSLSVKEGSIAPGQNVVYAVTTAEEPDITINKIAVKQKLFGGTKIDPKAKTIGLFDEKALKKYSLESVAVDNLDSLD